MFGQDAGPGIFDWISNKSCNYWKETFFFGMMLHGVMFPLCIFQFREQVGTYEKLLP